MRISDWSSDVCSSDLPRNLWPADRPDPAILVRMTPFLHFGQGLPSPSSGSSRSGFCTPSPRAGRSGQTACVQVGYLSQPRKALPLCLPRSEEHTSELQSLMRISYAVFCLKKTNSLLLTSKSYYNVTNYAIHTYINYNTS